MLRLPRFSSRLFLGIAIAFSFPVLAQSQISWNFAGPVGAPDRILALAVDPRSDSVLYVGTPDGGVWKTLDGGSGWTPLLETALSLQVCSLAIDPRSPDVIYLGTGDDQNPHPGQGVGRSIDGGRTWSFGVRFTNEPVCTLSVDPSDSKRIFAGSGEGLFLSTDSGVSWNKVLSSAVTSIAFDGDTIYAGTIGNDVPGFREQNLVRSTDGAHNWTYVPLPPNTITAAAETNWVSVNAAAGVISVLVSYESSPNQSFLDFYRTADAGTTWDQTFRIGQSRPPVALVTDPVTGNLFSLGVSLLAATNKGSSWYTVPTRGTGFHSAAFSGGIVILAGDNGLETAPFSQGTSSRPITQLPIGQFRGVTFDPTNSLWGAGPAGLIHLFPFTRAGDLRVPGVGPVGNVAVGANASPNVFAADGSLVYTSSDRGGRFTPRNVIPDTELRAPSPPFVLDPVTPSSAYMAGTRLYRTTDSGATWAAMGIVDPDPTHVVIALAMAPAIRSLMYAATACLPEVALVPCPTNSFFWRSGNGGTTWTQTPPIPGLVSKLAIDPRQPTTLYAAIGGYSGGDLLQSTNAGGTWFSVANNLPDVAVNSVIIDGSSLPPFFNLPAQTLYVGTDAGVFVTYNAGAQWTDISGIAEFTQSLPRSPITDLALRADGTLLAATFGRGIYYTSMAGFGPTVIANPLSLEVTVMQGTTLTTGLPLTNVTAAFTFGFRVNTVDSWIAVPQPNGEIRPGTTFRAGIAISAAGLQVGTYIGRLQVISGAAVQTVLVKAHVTPSPAKLTVVGGNTLNGGTGNTLGPIQVLVSDSKQTPIHGMQVRFTITSGGGSLSARTATTNAAGIAIAFLTLPSTPGTVRVSITAGDVSSTLTATAEIAPALFPESIVDGVTFNRYTFLGPGSVVSMSGQNLAEGIAVVSDSPMPAAPPAQMLTTRVVLAVRGNDVALQLLSVSPSQVRALLPASLAAGIYKLRIEVGLRRSNEVAITVAAFAPGILTQNGIGKGVGIFLKDDGSVVTAANPAERGGAVTFYASGLGAVNGADTVRTPRVYFDIYQAEVVSSGLSSNQPGRYQVTVRVPERLSPATNISVSLTIGGYTSNRVTIPVR